jgi:GT2 family glycosyltransferase
MASSASTITVSIVSHRQNRLVNVLLADLRRHCGQDVKILVTENVPDDVPLDLDDGGELIVNPSPKGFGANHNAAFGRCSSNLFCVVNPDVRLEGDPFPALRAVLSDPSVGAAGPLVRSPSGVVEDSARRFPTVLSLARKALAGQAGPDYRTDAGATRVDWVAGMFLLFRAAAFRAAGGFDERFFMYYEDVDICRRLRSQGLATVFEPRASVVHDARRASRRDPKLMAIHAASAFRYLVRRYT